MLRTRNPGYNANTTSAIGLPSSIFRPIVLFRPGKFIKTETNAKVQRLMMLRVKVRGEEWQHLLEGYERESEESEDFDERERHSRSFAFTRLSNHLHIWTSRRHVLSHPARDYVAFSSYSSLRDHPLSTAASKGSDEPACAPVPWKSLSRIPEDSVTTIFTDSGVSTNDSPAQPLNSSSSKPSSTGKSMSSSSSESNSSPRTDTPDWALLRAPPRKPYCDSAKISISLTGNDSDHLLTNSTDFPLFADTDLLIKDANNNTSLQTRIKIVLGRKDLEPVDLNMEQLAVLLQSYGVQATTIARVANRWDRLTILHELSRREGMVATKACSPHTSHHKQQTSKTSPSSKSYDHKTSPANTTSPPMVVNVHSVPTAAKSHRPSPSFEWIVFQKPSSADEEASSEISLSSGFSAKSWKFDPRKCFWRNVAEKEAKEYEFDCRFYV